MPITLTTTPLGSNSNSYAALDEADLYFQQKLFFSPTWVAMDESEQIARLVQATDALDRLFAWEGRKSRSEQRLQFPRIQRRNASRGYVLTPQNDADWGAVDQVERAVKEAQLEMLLFQYINQDSSEGTIPTQQLKKLQVLNQAVDVEYQPVRWEDQHAIAAGGTLATIHALMRPWVKSGGALQRA